MSQKCPQNHLSSIWLAFCRSSQRLFILKSCYILIFSLVPCCKCHWIGPVITVSEIQPNDCQLKPTLLILIISNDFEFQDLSARGIDILAIDLVIQFSPPHRISDYVHRVGRTARAGNSGRAILFLSPNEVQYVRELEDKKIR